VPQDHLLRPFKLLVDSILRTVSEEFAALYSTTACVSTPPERLVRASLLQVLYIVRSEPPLEQVKFNLLYRWFVGLGLNGEPWDDSTFSRRIFPAQCQAG